MQYIVKGVISVAVIVATLFALQVLFASCESVVRESAREVIREEFDLRDQRDLRQRYLAGEKWIIRIEETGRFIRIPPRPGAK